MDCSRLPVSLCLILLASVASASDPGSTELPAGFRIERSDQRIAITEAIHELRVDNPQGDIRVRMGQSGEILVHSVTQIFAETRQPPRLDQRESGHRLHLQTRYSGQQTPAHGRMDLVLFVPQGLSLDLRSKVGSLEVRKGSSHVRAHTRSGNVSVASRGRIDLESDTGLIRAGILAGKWQGASRIRTHSGQIVIALARNAQTDGRFRTCGAVAGVAMTTTGSGPCRKQTLRMGAASSRLDVRSRSGDIHLSLVEPAE